MNAHAGTPSNWGRWGDADERGTLNLLTSDGVVEAAGLVRHGRLVPMGRIIDPSGSANEDAVLEDLEVRSYAGHPSAGAVVETYKMRFHGGSWTHLDGLGHVWDAPGMWNGRRPDAEIRQSGVSWGDMSCPAHGLVGRGLLLDVVEWRSGEFVDADNPVTGEEVSAIAASKSMEIRSGDMLVIRAGRPEWEQANGPYGAGDVRPGLGASILEYMADNDCSVLISDMLDAKPHGLDRQWSVHSALYQLGAYLVDNADLTELSQVCDELGTFQFMVVIAPLPIRGATASPVSPLALF